MAANLVRKGETLIVHDVVEAPVRALKELGASAGATVAEVAGASEVIFTMLPTTAAVAEVIGGAAGVLAHAKPGAIVVDMSTIDPLVTDRLAADAAARGIAFADAPVGRLASHAERGESLFMVGAADETFATIRPLLEKMGTTIHHCGGVGTGMRTKLVNNYLAIISCQLNAEAIALSQRFGLDLAKTLEVIHGTTATNGQLKIAWPAKVLAGDTAPGFTIDLAHKGSDADYRGRECGQGPDAGRGRGARSVQRRAREGRRRAGFLVDRRRPLRRRRHQASAADLTVS
jgi:4-hydroxybutyrate dehydrogenase/sulfolactaldehyde 3-reductase